jgi:small subunit ribosomal protein S15
VRLTGNRLPELAVTTASWRTTFMAISVDSKKEIIQKFARSEGDTGSADVQIALLTTRIQALTEHLKSHEKDHASRRGLLKLVGQRRKLLRYLRTVDQSRYQEVLNALNLRR